MGFSRRFISPLILVLGLCLGGGAVPAAAGAERELKTDAKEKVDAVLVLDGSGSMRVTDPGRLRDEGAKLFLEFLKPGDRVGIVEFSGDAKIVRPLSPFERERVSTVAADVDKVGNSGQFTDILGGLKLAHSMLAEAPRADANQVIVLLSDGKLDPDPAVVSAASSRLALLDEFLPALKDSGVKVHTLAFGDQVDQELLEEIAAETDASSWFTPNASKIHESYAELFLVVKSPQVLPLTSKGFKIDAGIDEATFYINRESPDAAISLRSSDGSTITPENPPPSVRWFRGQSFDVVTVIQPRPGDWRISGLPSGDSFATVLTNLKLITDWPTSASLGSPMIVQARLYENEKPVVLREMAGATKYAFEITPSDKVSEPVVREFLFDDGSHGDRVAHDGIFSHSVELEDVGEYKLKVLARAPTFERSQQVPFKIKPRMVDLTVEHAGDHGRGEAAGPSHGEAAGHGGEHGAGPGGSGDVFQVTLSEDARALRRIDVKLTAVSSDKKRFVIPLEKTAEGFKGFSSFIPTEGEYQLRAVLTGEMRKVGKVRDGGGSTVSVREESPLVKYHKVVHAGEEEEVEVIVVKAEKQPSSAPYLLAVLIINLLLGAGLFSVMRRAGSGSSEPVPEFASIDSVRKLLQSLDARRSLVEVDEADPLFTGDEDLPTYSPIDKVLSGLMEPAPDGGAAPEGEAGASAESGSSAPAAETAPPAEGGEAPAEGT